ncbi:hypothetical protein HHX47_DHR2000961 [Lentinula edodes]|nr:hypothetical protein HHX47_DHR2000961 [Lentinula edodes]
MTQSAAGFIAGQPLSIIEDLRDRAAARRERPGTSRQTSYAFFGRVLWPALHYAVPDALETRLFHESASYKQYANANWPFTQRIGEVWKGDVGFFLNVAFPSSKGQAQRSPAASSSSRRRHYSPVRPSGWPPSFFTFIHPLEQSPSARFPSSQVHSLTTIFLPIYHFYQRPGKSRTGHAKQSSKFAQRLGFRNVVDQAKQVMVDEIQQLTHDIQRACMAAYHIELPPSVKSRIDPLHIPVDSTLSLPFISSTNLTVGGITRSANSSRSDLQQPSVSLSIAAGRVRPLYQTLINHAGPFADGSYPLPQLPLESLVISTLLIPFLTTDSASATEEDRWLSIEAFQIVVKTWNPTTEFVAAERSMWCVQAALSSPPPLRIRILIILWLTTESHYPASNAEVLQTLLHGLFYYSCLVGVYSHQLPTMRNRYGMMRILSYKRCKVEYFRS